MKTIYVEENFKDSRIGRIPMDWECVKIDKISGVNPKPIKLDTDETKVSFIGMADVSESAKLMNLTDTPYGEVKKGFTSFCDEDVLVAKITPCFENGKGALVSNLTNGIGFGSTEFHVIRAKQGIGCPEFIHQITTSYNFRAKGEMNMTGTAGQKRVGKSFISSYLIACPPFEEQQKIAEVLSTVDQKIDLIDQKIAETQNLKTGLMQKLFSEGIGVQDKDGHWQPHTEFKKSKFGMIPKTWSLNKLETYCSIASGVSPSKLPLSDAGYPFFKVEEFNYSPKFLSKARNYVDDAELCHTGEYLLLPKRGAAIFLNKLRIAKGTFQIDTNVMGISFNSAIATLEFMLYRLLYERIERIADVSTIPQINNKHINPYIVPLPSLIEQRKIAEILSTVDEKLALLEEQKAETHQLKKGLMQKLLTGEWRVPLENE